MSGLRATIEALFELAALSESGKASGRTSDGLLVKVRRVGPTYQLTLKGKQVYNQMERGEEGAESEGSA